MEAENLEVEENEKIDGSKLKDLQESISIENLMSLWQKMPPPSPSQIKPQLPSKAIKKLNKSWISPLVKSGDEWNCNLCYSSTFKTKLGAIKHLIGLHLTYKMFEVCQYCIEIFCNIDAIKLHNEKVHKNVQKISYKCKEKPSKTCYKIESIYLLNMKDHCMQAHSKAFFPYNCRLCDMSFDIKEEFLVHENTVHGTNHKELQCEACKITYYSKQLFAVHQYGCLSNTGDFF